MIGCVGGEMAASPTAKMASERTGCVFFTPAVNTTTEGKGGDDWWMKDDLRSLQNSGRTCVHCLLSFVLI